jgi:hypothetical protein
MLIFLCPKCFKVFACSDGGNLNECEECLFSLNKPCIAFIESKQIVTDVCCVDCEEEEIIKNN